MAAKETLKKFWDRFTVPWWAIGALFFGVEAFAFCFLAAPEGVSWGQFLQGLQLPEDLVKLQIFWPLAFAALWAVLLPCLLRLLPAPAGRIAFGITYLAALVYAGFQTGYYLLFGQMMWVTEFLYVSEGADYASVLFAYPLGWWLGLAALIALGVLTVVKFPRYRWQWRPAALMAAAAALSIGCLAALPNVVFLADRNIRYAGSDYGRAQSAQAAYENMFNPHRLYDVCGLYQTLSKDVYANAIYPLTPGYTAAQAAARQQIDDYFTRRGEAADNEMTGIFEGKNVVLVLMESMDDWILGEHTPTINRLMAEGINFTNFYTPPYGGVRTFNSEFCLNTGSYLSSQGGYAFDYVTNHFPQSLASLLTQAGYNARVYHYNDPNFYSRGVFSPAMGYESYVCYADYESDEDALYDDQLLFDNGELKADFFRSGQTLNFVITRSAHLSYKYNEVLSYWALKQYPEYRGMTGHEEMDCAYVKAKLVDDLFARLLQELEAAGQLENTVIVAMTDHYTYGVNDTDMLMERSGVEDALLVEKVPCFIWSADGPALQVEKTLQTADVLPTVLNLMGLGSPYSYIGRDAFDEAYRGYAIFSDGSWISGKTAYNAKTDAYLSLSTDGLVLPPMALCAEMEGTVQEFVEINNLILETDYYRN